VPLTTTPTRNKLNNLARPVPSTVPLSEQHHPSPDQLGRYPMVAYAP